MDRYLCIHGHFYQPPRENPWLEMIEVQDSAYPYHDWNERITAECYAPNSAARILTGDGRIEQLVNNYARISFNFGPTLLSWLEHKALAVYRAIQEADRESQRRFSGHGSALAQAYNHMILPLADRQDKHTQVAWGIRDFEYRFGRKPEGMWLPETAVNVESLEVLAEQGIRFTILSPYQAARTRKLGEEAWQDVKGGKIDPSRAYLQKLPSGKSIALFFYDGPIARAIAFEGLLAKGDVLANRLLGGFSDTRDWPQLVHVATDGESYGHHHAHGDMALAFALHHIEHRKLARLTNYGEFLEKQPPTHEVEILENTAWSCSHGIERWRSDCGCNSGRQGWTQAWRGPLRTALDWLRDTLKPAYENLAGEFLRDPWAARNEFIDVLLERTPASQDRFLERHACRNLSEGDRVVALKLLEMQRNALLMYTSCGWFFDEISGIEGTQILLYAGRALQLGQELLENLQSMASVEASARRERQQDSSLALGPGESTSPGASGTPSTSGLRLDARQADARQVGAAPAGNTNGRAARALEESFLDLLSKAPSNVPELHDGRRVFERFVKPLVVTLDTLAGFYAVRSLFEEFAPEEPLFCFRAERAAYEALPAGKTKFVSGRVRIVSELTREAATLDFAALSLGDHNVNAGVREWREGENNDAFRQACAEAFTRADFPQILRLMVEQFGASTYSLQSLFRDEQRRILKQVLRNPLSEAETAYRRLYEQHLPLMRFLAHLGSPMPRAFQTVAEFLFNTDLRWLLESDEPDLHHARTILGEAATWKVHLDRAGHGYRFSKTIERMAERWRQNPTDLSLLQTVDATIDLARSIPFPINLWTVQNIYFELRSTAFPRMQELGATGDDITHLWLETFVGLGDKLRIHVAELHQRVEQVKLTPTVAELVREAFAHPRIPGSTYRFQFHHAFRFSAAKELVSYLADLGVTDCYASPILEARSGSTHCYDICNPTRLNPDLGGNQEFEEFTAALKQHGMGLLIDTVPNHMGIGDARNVWWSDVLENGVSSIYAPYFDIDWHPTNPNLENKLLLPVLEDQYGHVLEQGKIQLAFEDGAFSLRYHTLRLPVDPGTYSLVLERLLPRLVEKLGEENEKVRELQSILTALGYLPPRTELPQEKIAEKNREKEVVKRRLAALIAAEPALQETLDVVIQEFNGKGGAPHNFDLLDRMVESQAYRLAFWRVATEEINYRRFFDINELAAIRMELPEVFEASHELLLSLLADGKGTGLRIDHPDGLLNPTEYFRRLQLRYVEAWVRRRLPAERVPVHLAEEVAAECAALAEPLNKPHGHWPLYVVAEKILSEDEPLPADWAVYGTTGYDFLSLVNGLFVDPAQREAFDRIYTRFIHTTIDFQQLVRSTKTMILQVSMASEINALSHQLDRISEGNRRYRDFTLNSLALATREIIACLRVYRAYITSPDVALRDRLFIEEAVAEAARRNPRLAAPIFDFIRDSLLMRNLNDFREEDRPRLIAWSMKFQQLCGPIMAKGVEDTAFYIFNRLVSLNEVGSHPDQFGVELAEFHHQNILRQERWPHSMLALSTHDTKRSEDVRARLNVLSEMPDRWDEALKRWTGLNAAKKVPVANLPAPYPNDEYLLYQTLLGIWPHEPLTAESLPAFRERIVGYMEKATHEAKVHTSWINPNQEYDAALRQFVLRLLPDAADDDFLREVDEFAGPLRFFGYVNSLSQTLLKMTCPGVPDLYQGTELWDFSLVDPDNRRPVDYALRRKLLAELRDRIEKQLGDLVPWAKELLAHLTDGRAKLFVIERVLNFRKQHPQLFNEGRYSPLDANGTHGEHVCSYLRQAKGETVLVVVPRLVYRLTGGQERVPLGAEVWSDTHVVMPADAAGAYRNVFTGERVEAIAETVKLEQVMRNFPIALLMRETTPDNAVDRNAASPKETAE